MLEISIQRGRLASANLFHPTKLNFSCDYPTNVSYDTQIIIIPLLRMIFILIIHLAWPDSLVAKNFTHFLQIQYKASALAHRLYPTNPIIDFSLVFFNMIVLVHSLWGSLPSHNHRRSSVIGGSVHHILLNVDPSINLLQLARNVLPQ